jgi:hypothetical protein
MQQKVDFSTVHKLSVENVEANRNRGLAIGLVAETLYDAHPGACQALSQLAEEIVHATEVHLELLELEAEAIAANRVLGEYELPPSAAKRCPGQ